MTRREEEWIMHGRIDPVSSTRKSLFHFCCHTTKEWGRPRRRKKRRLLQQKNGAPEPMRYLFHPAPQDDPRKTRWTTSTIITLTTRTTTRRRTSNTTRNFTITTSITTTWPRERPSRPYHGLDACSVPQHLTIMMMMMMMMVEQQPPLHHDCWAWAHHCDGWEMRQGRR